jgi:hypothetical protein
MADPMPFRILEAHSRLDQQQGLRPAQDARVQGRLKAGFRTHFLSKPFRAREG